MALSAPERAKLIGILGLLASDFDGERASAALLASRMVKARGLTWGDVIAAGGGAGTSAGKTPGGHAPGSARQDDLTLCLHWLGELSPWEVGFVTDLRARRKPMTPGQAAKLAQVAGLLRARGLV